MSLSLKVHHHEKVPGQLVTRLIKVTPYVRLSQASHPPLYVQGGKVYGEGGDEVTELPDWFEKEMAKLTPKVRQEVGWNPQRTAQPEPAPAPAPAAVEPEITWACPECNQVMSPRKKGVHIAGHRRRKGV